MVVPCIEKIWLYSSGVRRVIPGLMSCVRITMANATATRKKTSDVQMYSSPMRLWSVVVSHTPMPRRLGLDVGHLSSSR